MTQEQQIKDAVRLFLKRVSGTAERELEKVVRNAIASGKLKPTEDLTTTVTLTAEKIGLDVTIHSKIEL
jgi:Family of unknown function (DUF6494)